MCKGALSCYLCRMHRCGRLHLNALCVRAARLFLLQMQLAGEIDLSLDVDMYNIDLFGERQCPEGVGTKTTQRLAVVIIRQ